MTSLWKWLENERGGCCSSWFSALLAQYEWCGQESVRPFLWCGVRGNIPGKETVFVFQGASPTKEQLAAGDYTAGRYAGLYGFDYQGMATNKKRHRNFPEIIRSYQEYLRFGKQNEY